MNLLSRSMVCDLIRMNSGKIFSCVFIKKDGTVRKMRCRTNVKKYLKGGKLPYDPAERGLIPVWEVKGEEEIAETGDASYRMINLNTLISIRIAGVEYRVMDLIQGEKQDSPWSSNGNGKKTINW